MIKKAIARLGGPDVVAGAFDPPMWRSAITNWYSRGIPAEHILILTPLLVDAGVKYDAYELFNLRKSRKPRKKRGKNGSRPRRPEP